MAKYFDGVLLLRDLTLRLLVLCCWRDVSKYCTFVFTRSTKSLYWLICCSSFCRASAERTTGPEPRDIPCYTTSALLCTHICTGPQHTLAICGGRLVELRTFLEPQPRRNIAPLRVACLPARHPPRKAAVSTPCVFCAPPKPKNNSTIIANTNQAAIAFTAGIPPSSYYHFSPLSSGQLTGALLDMY